MGEGCECFVRIACVGRGEGDGNKKHGSDCK
jgi:hypothetical protein